MFKSTIWAEKVLSLQDEDGKWGYFHTLSQPNKYPINTEMALRRLRILGFTLQDEPIQRAVTYMQDCLYGKKTIPDRSEKLHNWDLFTQMMLSACIIQFTDKCEKANSVANTWANVITQAFASGAYNHTHYIAAYAQTFRLKPQGGRFVDFVSFYQVALLANRLDANTQSIVFDYILHHPYGIYYVYGNLDGLSPLCKLPAVFSSKSASRYLGAIELLAQYHADAHKLQFVADWLYAHKNEQGVWDMGSTVNDKVYFPLHNSWRRKEDRQADCTYRIQNLIDRIR